MDPTPPASFRHTNIAEQHQSQYNATRHKASKHCCAVCCQLQPRKKNKGPETHRKAQTNVYIGYVHWCPAPDWPLCRIPPTSHSQNCTRFVSAQNDLHVKSTAQGFIIRLKTRSVIFPQIDVPANTASMGRDTARQYCGQ